MNSHVPPSPFSFATAGQIVFGTGTIDRLPEIAAPLGKKILVVCGAHPTRIKPIIDALDQEQMETFTVSVAGEPKVADIEAAVACAKGEQVDLVIAIGGGSVLDAGKAIAILITNPGEPLDYMEVIGRGKSLDRPSCPCIAIPTTAGTGAEVTANAVIESPQNRVKVSLRSPLMLPRVALIDPALTCSVPPLLTATTGMDALTQVLEPFVSGQATPLTDLFCRDGLHRASNALRQAFDNGLSLEARTSMSLVSLYGGLALANAKLGAVHGIAGPFGGMYPAPHGAVCAALLPHVMRTNINALQHRAPEHPSLVRYREVACLLTGNPEADIMDGPAWVSELVAHFAIPGLSAYGFKAEEKGLLIDKAGQASSMQGNPVQLTRPELSATLEAAL